MTDKIEKPDAEWARELTPEEYRILRQKGTEQAFSGKFWNSRDQGTFVCAGCGNPLFASGSKFDSGTGWPSFSAPVAPQSVGTEKDDSLYMRRTEVHCARCEGHLGHVFEDGPRPTGLRYCINSASLKLEKD